MDKIDKILRKASPKDSKKIIQAMEKIRKGNLIDLDIKKLKDYAYLFRVRVGNYRVIYQKIGPIITVLDLHRRSEDTYKNF